MTPPVILGPSAQADFDAAADWYEAQAGRGPAFTAAVRRALLDIGSMPRIHPAIVGDVRAAMVSGFPYAIYYRAEPDRVSVLAIYHTSRDPGGWQDRI